jgi:hypothetical protein
MRKKLGILLSIVCVMAVLVWHYYLRTTIADVELSEHRPISTTSAESPYEAVMLERMFHAEDVIERFGEPGATEMVEGAFRNYAEARLIELYDLTGDGRVDGYGLRAMAQGHNNADPKTLVAAARR